MFRTLIAVVVLTTMLAVNLEAVEAGSSPWSKIASSATSSTCIFVGELITKTDDAFRITGRSALTSRNWETMFASGTFKVEEVLRGSPGQGDFRACWHELPKGETQSPSPDPGRLSVGDRGVWFVHNDRFIGRYIAYREPPESLALVRLVLSEMDSLGLLGSPQQASEDEAKWREFQRRLWSTFYSEDGRQIRPLVPSEGDSSKVERATVGVSSCESA